MSKLIHKLNEKFVGATIGRPRFGEISKKENGITLIALIITIIVMLILTGVTLSITLGDNGLVNKAKEAKIKTETEIEREKLLDIVAITRGDDGLIDYAALNDNLPEGFSGINGLYTSEKSGIVFKVNFYGEISVLDNMDEDDEIDDELKKYIFGEDGNGAEVSDIFNMQTFSFINVPAELEENGGVKAITLSSFSEELITVADSEGNDIIDGIVHTDVYIEYAGNIYKLRARTNCNAEKGKTLSEEGLTKISYDMNSKIGKYVKYDGEIWRVLYDDDINGLQMISEDGILDDGRRIGLGVNDMSITEEEVTEIDGVEGKSDLEKAMYSYANVVELLNKKCENIVTKKSGIIKSVRSVGSNPITPNLDNSESFIGSSKYVNGYDEWFEDNLNLKKNSKENRIYYTIKDTEIEYTIKNTDLNHLIDYDRMVALGIFLTENNEEYWLASREAHNISLRIFIWGCISMPICC